MQSLLQESAVFLTLALCSIMYIVPANGQFPTTTSVNCSLPVVIGPCLAIFPRYYYNSDSSNCEPFNYGGCQGNANRFDSLAECKSACSKDICSLPVEVGPCKAYLPSFHYNSLTQTCDSFVYGGCQGNANRFNTTQECRKTCNPVNTTACDSRPGCRNGGHCETDFTGRPSCSCTPGFYGEFCEFSRDPCFNMTCDNGGYCTAPADYPYCVCQKGYFGDSCQFSSTDPTTLCMTVRCSQGTECRPVYQSNSVTVARCVNVSQTTGLDDVCIRNQYLTSLLLSNPLSDVYSVKTCSVGSMVGQLCPTGSVCVEERGNGTCCTGKPEVKPGTCPVVQPGSVGVCGGTLCNSDSDCSGDDKCCSSSCGGQLCTAMDLGCGRCDAGFTCVQRPVTCPPGRFCIQALVPTCVPEACADCSTSQECRNVTNKEPCRSGENCPEFRYFCAIKGNYACGLDLPCPEGQSCQSAIKCAMTSRRRRRQADGFEDILDPYCARDTYCQVDFTTPPKPTTPTNYDVSTLCDSLRCTQGVECRPVSKCDMCLHEAHCADIRMQSDIDDVCTRNRYMTALLVALPNSTSTYNTKKCPVGFFQEETCPLGSVCVAVDEGNGIGVCCTGKPDVKPDVKPGTCPAVKPGDIGVCGGIFCNDDAGCPGMMKCCDSPCGGKLCTQPLTEITTTSRPLDNCGGCPSGQKCVDTGIRCIMPPCPTWQCQADCGGHQCSDDQECQLLPTPCAPGSLRCDPMPVCMGKPCSRKCPGGQKCETRNSCNRWGRSCRSREKCFPVPTASCPGGCGQGQVCQWEARACWTFFCRFRTQKFDAKCVDLPVPPRKGICPLPPKSRGCFWRQFFMFDECSNDNGCDVGRKCCEGECGVKVCEHPF